MWDFSFRRTLAIMVRTWPFIALRLVVYFAITLAYVVATGTGAGIGYGVGHITDAPLIFALWGGIFGFGLVGMGVYWLREYLLYGVKAGHIAVMAHLVDGRPVPGGRGQIAYASSVVRERFAEANVLFVIDQLIKGVLVAVSGLVVTVANAVPIIGLQGLAGFVNSVLRIAITYVDEIILAHNIRSGSTNAFDGAREGLILYAQNGGLILKNAVWLAIFLWVLTGLVFLLMLAPAAAVLYVLPGPIAGWSFVVALVFAWAIKAALIEPFAIAALMQVYLRATEGQVPDPVWDRRLTEASHHFRALKAKIVDAFRGAPTGPASA